MNETPASCVATIAALIDGSFPAASEYHSPPQPVPAVPLLFDHVTQSRWRDAIHRCMSHPQEADYQDPSSGITALHAACRTPATPPSVIFALLKAYPRASLMHTKHYASTPLHFACWRNLPIEVILMLLSVFPMAAAQENGLGLTPLHLAARTKNVTVVEALLQTFPAAVRSHRVAGYTPLHLAVRGAASAIQQELSSRNSEDASIIETEHNVYGQSSSSLSAALSVVRSMVYEDPSVVGIKDQDGDTSLALFCKSMESSVRIILHQTRHLHHAKEDGEESLFLKNHPLVMDCWITFLVLVRAASPLAFIADNGDGIIHAIAGNLDCLESFSFTLLALTLHGDSDLATFSAAGNLPLHIMANLSVKPGRYHQRRRNNKQSSLDLEDQESSQNGNDEPASTLNAMDLFLAFNKSAAAVPNKAGNLPLHILLSKKVSSLSNSSLIWQQGVTSLLKANPAAVTERDQASRLYPFMMAAASASACRTNNHPENNDCDGGVVDEVVNNVAASNSVTTTFQLLRACPEISRFVGQGNEVQAPNNKRRRIQ
jgi:hypothetical protein